MGVDIVVYVDEDLDQTHKSNFSMSNLIRHFITLTISNVYPRSCNSAYIPSSLYANTD